MEKQKMEKKQTACFILLGFYGGGFLKIDWFSTIF